MLIFVNGTFCPAAEATVSAQDRGFRFGDGVFETIAVYNMVPYQWDFHMQRLAESLRALDIAYDINILRPTCDELIRRNRLAECTLRVAISRGVGSRGYLPLPGITPTLMIETLPRMAFYYDTPVTLWHTGIEKISARALPVHCKLAQGVNSMLARADAEAHRCFDALQVNAKGLVCETSSANLLWLKGETLHTPALSCGVLKGSTRHILLALSPWLVAEGEYTLQDLLQADAVMLCSSAIQVIPVGELQPEGWQWSSVAQAQQLRTLLLQDIRRQCGDSEALRKSS